MSCFTAVLKLYFWKNISVWIKSFVVAPLWTELKCGLLVLPDPGGSPIAELFPAGGFEKLQLASRICTEWVWACTLWREFMFGFFFFLRTHSCFSSLKSLALCLLYLSTEWAHFCCQLDTCGVFWHDFSQTDCAVVLVCDYLPVRRAHIHTSKLVTAAQFAGNVLDCFVWILKKGARSFGYGYWSGVAVPLRVHFLCQSQAAAISQPAGQTRWQMGPPQTLTLPTPHMPHLSTQAGWGLHLTFAPSCCIPIHHNNSWAPRVFDCLLTIRGHMFTSKWGSPLLYSVTSPLRHPVMGYLV